MRTVLFFGLTYIGDSIAAQTGFSPSELAVNVGMIVFVMAVVADLRYLSGASK